jgi:hypothetical protein
LVLSKLASGYPLKVNIANRLTRGKELTVGFEDEVAEPVPHLVYSAFPHCVNHKASIVEEVWQLTLVNLVEVLENLESQLVAQVISLLL